MRHFIRGVMFWMLVELCLRSVAQGRAWVALAAGLIAGATLALEVLVWDVWDGWSDSRG
jgi:hypothetical protein